MDECLNYFLRTWITERKSLWQLRGLRFAPAEHQRLAPNEPAQTKEESVQSDEAQAEVQKSGMSVSYQVGMPVTIPADGQAHRANVTVLNLAGSPEYVTTPKLDSAVFL